MDENTSKLGELMKYEGTDRVVHFTDYLLAQVTDRTAKRFVSGFPFFEEKIQGLESGEVVVLTGNTKQGKTLFAESWLHSIMQRNAKAGVAIFSFEVQTERLLAKYVKEDQLPIYVPSELRTMDFEWLRNRCLEAKLKYGASIVLVDHLHFLVDMATKQNMSLNIGAFMRRLKKDIALDLNMAVILIAHQGQPKDEREASIGGLRDSSFIAQECDSVIIVQRRKNYGKIDRPDLVAKYGEEKIDEFFRGIEMADSSAAFDEYSQGLTIVKIGCHRRTGVFDAKKLFQKRGSFLAEI